MNADVIKKRLAKLDEWLADGQDGLALYQILSGSVRGPDDGMHKGETTMHLRRICFPKTCSNGNTGMMSNSAGSGTPGFSGTGGSGHFRGHVNQAISYLSQAGLIPAKKATSKSPEEPTL